MELQPPFFDHFETFWSLDPRRVRRVSHTSARQLSLPSRASEVASSEVSAIAEVKFAPRVAQVMISLGRTYAEIFLFIKPTDKSHLKSLPKEKKENAR